MLFTDIDPTAASSPFEAIATKIALAIAIGILVGLERQWAQKEVGVRTFSIVTLLGTLTSLLGVPYVITAIVGVFLLVVFLNVQSLLRDRSLEMTTSISLIIMPVLGTLVGTGHYFTAASSGIVMTMLLAWKIELAKFTGALKLEEIHGAVMLALLSVVVYPLLPDRFIDPWNLVNPRQAWMTVVLIAGIGFVNYVLLRLFAAKGIYYAAILGGLVNSTAAAAELSALLSKSKQDLRGRFVAAILLTNVAMFARNLVLLLIFAPKAAETALGPLALMALLSVGFALRYRGRDAGPPPTLHLSSPVSWRRVAKFAGIFLLLAIVATVGQRQFKESGFLVISAFGGFISSASTTATAASLTARGEINPQLAGIATVITSIASALVNIPLIYQQTHQPWLIRRLGFISLSIAALGILWLFLPLNSFAADLLHATH